MRLGLKDRKLMIDSVPAMGCCWRNCMTPIFISLKLMQKPADLAVVFRLGTLG
jgi:hypothetical protein